MERGAKTKQANNPLPPALLSCPGAVAGTRFRPKEAAGTRVARIQSAQREACLAPLPKSVLVRIPLCLSRMDGL